MDTLPITLPENLATYLQTQIASGHFKGFPNYLILSQLTDDNIEIIRVLHGARNLEITLSETENPQ
jgi:plasmid stabilization system protein ParE